MDKQKQRSLANSFREMHHGPKVLVLPNAWDVASARVFEEAGVRAIATSSAGVAFSLGYPDGQRISRDEMLSTVARISAAVKVPVTADVESGYGAKPEDAARTAAEVTQAGAIGMNLEDGTDDPEHPLIDLALAVEKVQAVREAARSAGVPLVLNARTDVYLLNVGPTESRFSEALRRAVAFRDAGADCIFLPGLTDGDTISRFIKELGCPVNVLVGPGSPTISELQHRGVARVSLGSAPMRAAMGLLRRLARELQESGTYASLEGAVPHAEMNRLLARKL
jgi:2-methylisocitrate lyase-like PEP mutase family enzyme